MGRKSADGAHGLPWLLEYGSRGREAGADAREANALWRSLRAALDCQASPGQDRPTSSRSALGHGRARPRARAQARGRLHMAWRRDPRRRYQQGVNAMSGPSPQVTPRSRAAPPAAQAGQNQTLPQRTTRSTRNVCEQGRARAETPQDDTEPITQTDQETRKRKTGADKGGKAPVTG